MANGAINLPSSLLQPRDEGEAETLKSILGRIHDERGHFRHITEDSLQTEIAARENEEESSDTDEDEDAVETDGADGKDRREQLYAARAEMLPHVATAQNEALIALDFISLLLSKDAPKQAELTMSPALKQQIRPGTLAMDVWQNMQPDKEHQRVDPVIARGWRMQSLRTSADSLLGAATRLEKNVRRESRYWEQVLSVSEKGWSISRMPRERHNLGVRFGFLEALGEFRDRGLAALRSDEVGNVILDKGLGNKSRVVRVRILQGDNLVGVSNLPNTSDESEPTLEARIRHSRDSLYEEELFHEIIRESRNLASYGINMRESTIHLPTRLSSRTSSSSAADSHEVLIDLVPLSDVGQQQTEEKQPQDTWAQAIALALRLLLSYTHRERLARRSEIPPPISTTKREDPVATIMRPILTLLQHRSVLADVDAYLNRLKKLLDTASIQVSVESAAFDPEYFKSAESIDALMQRALTPLQSQSKVSLKMPHRPEALEFGIEIRTTVLPPVFGSVMSVTSPTGLPRVDVSEIEDFREHLDAAVASALGHGIADKLTDWTLNDRSGVLSRMNVDGNDKINVELYVREDVSQDRLSLKASNENFEWRSEEVKQTRQFWDVVKQQVWDGAR